VHDRQDSGVDQCMVVGSRKLDSDADSGKTHKKWSVALERSGRHYNERSIIIEFNENSSSSSPYSP
jgi:hypothetical protein